jgi:hypothetical protein
MRRKEEKKEVRWYRVIQNVLRVVLRRNRCRRDEGTDSALNLRANK